MMKKILPLLLLLACSLSSCVTEDTYDNSIQGNYEALWTIIDQHYCFFDAKQKEYGLDWDAVHKQYQDYLTPSMTNEQLFEVLGRMLGELRDGHVNLTSSYNMSRYWSWQENYPINFSDSIQKNYLGTDYFLSQSIKYRVLPQNIGYLYCPTFESNFGSGNLSAIISHLAVCSGLIVDVRSNQGGLLTAAQSLAECFINQKTTGGYICHKTGTSHSDFSKPQSFDLTPAEGVRWQKPVIVLTNRKTYSAANTFVMFMKEFDNVQILGDSTGGGGGMPFSSEIPNGWSVRFSACPMYDAQMNPVEGGIAPDIRIGMTADDMAKGRDTMIEEAIRLLQAQ